MTCFNFGLGHDVRLPDSIEDTHGKSDSLGKKVKMFNDQHAATFSLTGGGKANGPNTAPSPSKSRTLCQPEFGPDDKPVDPLRVWEPTTQLLKGELEQKHEPLESNLSFININYLLLFLVSMAGCAVGLRPLCSCTATSNKDLQVFVCKDYAIWLLNTLDTPLECKAGELFGYNVGSFEEKSPGRAVRFKVHVFGSEVPPGHR